MFLVFCQFYLYFSTPRLFVHFLLNHILVFWS
uniref:Uncharacterized protein n=1 Tax=Rhizophora mucronata TaxID=61149 RepID=A0A2P2QQR2_RHIMU